LLLMNTLTASYVHYTPMLRGYWLEPPCSFSAPLADGSGWVPLQVISEDMYPLDPAVSSNVVLNNAGHAFFTSQFMNRYRNEQYSAILAMSAPVYGVVSQLTYTPTRNMSLPMGNLSQSSSESIMPQNQTSKAFLQVDCAGTYDSESLDISCGFPRAQSESGSDRSRSRQSSSDQPDELQVLMESKLDGKTPDQQKVLIRELGEEYLENVLVRAPKLVRADSKNYKCVIKIQAKIRNLSRMGHFVINQSKASMLTQASRVAVIESREGVICLIEFKDESSLSEICRILKKSYNKCLKFQIVQLDGYSITGPVYKFSQLAYRIVYHKKKIIESSFGVQILEHSSLDEFSAMNLEHQTWGRVEEYFGNFNADLNSMADLCNKLQFRRRMIEEGRSFEDIKYELERITSPLALFPVMSALKNSFQSDSKQENRESAEKKFETFLDKNNLGTYDVFSLKVEATKRRVLNAFCNEEGGEIERVYHICMGEINSNKNKK